MCVGCRRSAAQRDLIRLSLRDGEVVVSAGPAGGRSAYLCPEPDCLEAALRRRALPRAFRAPARAGDETKRQILKVCATMKGGEVSGTHETDC
jgi:uncharacterized protein